ncbi:hypothetical protein FSPOR_11020 [Fusarium sporotrichioides]|uniref:Uncharacterized protein n=1 Tax=Fusarium sporotrichioides TaxID=5514 RepID=A0A395RIH0_FUSSP|nr:hypothetical protein FSPOR_11020 [Fusarium sporotrichioides]
MGPETGNQQNSNSLFSGSVQRGPPARNYNVVDLYESDGMDSQCQKLATEADISDAFGEEEEVEDIHNDQYGTFAEKVNSLMLQVWRQRQGQLSRLERRNIFFSRIAPREYGLVGNMNGLSFSGTQQSRGSSSSATRPGPLGRVTELSVALLLSLLRSNKLNDTEAAQFWNAAKATWAFQTVRLFPVQEKITSGRAAERKIKDKDKYIAYGQDR